MRIRLENSILLNKALKWTIFAQSRLKFHKLWLNSWNSKVVLIHQKKSQKKNSGTVKNKMQINYRQD